MTVHFPGLRTLGFRSNDHLTLVLLTESNVTKNDYKPMNFICRSYPPRLRVAFSIVDVLDTSVEF